MNKKTIYLLLSALFGMYGHAGFAQAPDLGIAGGFALFTATGAFGNSGATTITGNIGTNSGAVSGNPTVIGQTHVADSVSALAAADVDTAYGFLNALTCDSTIGTTLGNSQVLTPKIYCVGGIATLNGNLILDGQNNPNSIFIFKVNGALSVNALSHIILIDSASACNIYWQINGAFVAGDSSDFEGTLIANGAITFSDGAHLSGSALSTGGAISLHNNLAGICVPLSLMPVTLVSFSAWQSAVLPRVELAWQTAFEHNSANFLIERSTDGFRFLRIGVVEAAGYSNHLLSYAFTDEQPEPGINYYRLNQTDFDGSNAYSPTRAVVISGAVPVARFSPNPFATWLTVALPDEWDKRRVNWQLYNEHGAEVINRTIQARSFIIATGEFPAGIYFYVLRVDGDVVQAGKLVCR